MCGNDYGALLCLFVASPGFAKNVKLRSADTHAKDYPTVQAVEHMGKLLNEWTDGRITIKIYPGRQLGEEKATIEQTIAGALDLNRVNLAPLNAFIPETAIPALPYIFRSTEHMYNVMDGPSVVKFWTP